MPRSPWWWAGSWSRTGSVLFSLDYTSLWHVLSQTQAHTAMPGLAPYVVHHYSWQLEGELKTSPPPLLPQDPYNYLWHDIVMGQDPGENIFPYCWHCTVASSDVENVMPASALGLSRCGWNGVVSSLTCFTMVVFIFKTSPWLLRVFRLSVTNWIQLFSCAWMVSIWSLWDAISFSFPLIIWCSWPISSVFLTSRISWSRLMVVCMLASIVTLWSDISPEHVSNCASAVWIVLNCFSIGSSEDAISPLYLSNASSSGA